MRKNSKMKFLKLIIVVIILFFSSSCNQENQNTSFFLGGEIINPSSGYVNFYYNNIKIDSIELDSNNKFFKKIEDIKPGIYRIEHVPENQNIIVENGDSLWIRVNVEDFKESLTFSGKGSSKNNFLVDMSILDESETGYISEIYSQESDVFRNLSPLVLIIFISIFSGSRLLRFIIFFLTSFACAKARGEPLVPIITFPDLFLIFIFLFKAVSITQNNLIIEKWISLSWH